MKLRVRVWMIAAAAFAAAAVPVAKAQTRAWADSILQQLGNIAVEPLEILPVSDCRLDNLEQAVAAQFSRTAHSGVRVFSTHPLMPALQAKRAVIDFRRSHIDSLYYLQALQAVNAAEPDYAKAMQYIEKSLQFNRFFARSVVFKMNHLLKRERNAQLCLRYLNTTLQEFSSHPKVNNAAQATYNTLLEQTTAMLEKELYQDALDLCLMIGSYCRDGFPIHYQRYKEKQLENLARQGLYRSYYDVAVKAFGQDRYQMAQKYAMLAFHYYREHEENMAGVNYAIELLDRIAARYLEFASLSDPEESFYYRHLVDEIVKETGLEEILFVPYDAELDIAEDLALLNRTLGEAPEESETYTTSPRVTPVQKPATEPAVTPDKLRERKAPDPVQNDIPKPEQQSEQQVPQQEPQQEQQPAPVKLTPAQAKELYAAAWDQANLLRSKRRFLEACQWYDEAARIQDEYKLKPDPDFIPVYAGNTVQTVEQLLNKAVYHTWNNRDDLSDSLYTQARNLGERFGTLYPDDESTPLAVRQLLRNYESRRDESNCQKLAKSMNEACARFNRQVAYGNLETSRAEYANMRGIHARYGQGLYVSCHNDSTELQKATRLLTAWGTYHRAMQSAVQYLTDNARTENFDIARLVDDYTRAVNLYDSLSLRGILAAPVSLFSRLSNAKEYRLLGAWSILCHERGDLKQSTFIYDYLTAQGYKDQDFEKHGRRLKKDKEKAEKGAKK